jgi:acyl carrier protein
MSYNNTKDGLFELIEDLRPGTKFNEKLNLVEDLNFDSLDLISFLFEVQSKFDVKIPDEDIDTYKLFRIDNLCNYIEKKNN